MVEWHVVVVPRHASGPSMHRSAWGNDHSTYTYLLQVLYVFVRIWIRDEFTRMKTQTERGLHPKDQLCTVTRCEAKRRTVDRSVAVAVQSVVVFWSTS